MCHQQYAALSFTFVGLLSFDYKSDLLVIITEGNHRPLFLFSVLHRSALNCIELHYTRMQYSAVQYRVLHCIVIQCSTV